ncbi:MAG: hypothetical protein EAZ30_10300 [Betaproteobacteria bacterium]|nr:MAG: hypothetical protein EAZ43_07725 [Betaproteobacteria bacterium]TAG47177.1 MAG: hypothetical protein EAZ30_10300 [Betaproteobacteria bacterium]
MTAFKFRSIAWLHLALAVLGAGAAFLPNGLSPELAAAFDHEPVPSLFGYEWALYAIALFFIALFLAGFVGLLMFKPWGRTLSLCMTVVLLLVYPLFGPTLMTGLESALLEAAALTWGAVLALAYYSEVSVKFSESSSTGS